MSTTTTTKGTRLGVAAAIAGLAIGVLAASCASTNMTDTWTDPSAKGAALSKVAVLALTRDDGLRRIAEDTAVTHMQGAQAVPSYRVLGTTDLRDRDAVKAKLREAGFDGVLIMRLAGVSERVSATSGPYGTFDGYYAWAGTMVYAPGYLETDTIVHVVSNLYELDNDKLIWSGVSQTFNPSSAKQFMNDVSKAVAKSLQKDRLVL